jgi:hypothetical protein
MLEWFLCKRDNFCCETGTCSIINGGAQQFITATVVVILIMAVEIIIINNINNMGQG